MTEKNRTPLILLTGLSREANRTLARRFCSDNTAVVHHDLRDVASGVVLRSVRFGVRESLTTLELAHGCVSCTLREDLLPIVRQLAEQSDVEQIVLQLDESMEPEQVSWALRAVFVNDRPVIDDVEIEAVVTAFDENTLLDDATGDEVMIERGIFAVPDDERTVAQVALAQIEFADVLVRANSAPDSWTTAKTEALLSRIAPTTAVLELENVSPEILLAAMPSAARRGIPDDPHGSVLRGQPPLHRDCGMTVLPFTARKPFHPQRLHDTLDVLIEGTVRTRGRVWVASQPDTALWIESAGGGATVGHLGPWLDSPHGPSWDDVSAERRTLAALRWDPFFGDRDQDIVVVAHQEDPETIEAALQNALITDEELAEGRGIWASYDDPFGDWHEEPCQDGANTEADSGARLHDRAVEE